MVDATKIYVQSGKSPESGRWMIQVWGEDGSPPMVFQPFEAEDLANGLTEEYGERAEGIVKMLREHVARCRREDHGATN